MEVCNEAKVKLPDVDRTDSESNYKIEEFLVMKLVFRQ